MTDKLNEVVAALNAATTKEGLAIRAEVVDAIVAGLRDVLEVVGRHTVRLHLRILLCLRLIRKADLFLLVFLLGGKQCTSWPF